MVVLATQCCLNCLFKEKNPIMRKQLIIIIALGLFALGNYPVKAKSLKLDDLFEKDRVIKVDIKVSESNWDKLRLRSRNFFEALQPSRQFEPPASPYEYVEASVTIDGVTYPKVGIRKKGFIGSQDTNRPSLKIKLDYFDKDQEIDGLNNLTFNNNKQDTTLMNQFMCYDLFDQAGSPGSRCGFANIIVNGKNLGIYAHVESVRKHLLKREFGSSKGTLYEGTVVDFYKDWEGSFERKTGKKKKGLESILDVINVMEGGSGTPLFSGNFPGRALVPENGAFDKEWFKPEFDDSQWISGKNGAGFETEQGYEKLIQKSFDFEEQMNGKATSLYLRFPFELKDIESLKETNLALRMKCDDGFVAYINGQEVARFNAPENPSWDSAATDSRADPSNMTFSDFDISKHIDLLHEGENLLAIHGMNNSRASSDFLIVAELAKNDFQFEKELWKHIDEESFYKFWALEGLVSFWDGYSGNRNNFFVYLNPETDKLHFMPWGTDCAFQKYSPLGVDRRSPRSVRTVGIICHRLYQLPAVRKKYAATMKSLLAKYWDEKKLLAETERVESLLDPYLSSEQRRRVRYEPIRQFIRNRRADIEREINGEDMPLWNSTPEPPPVIGGKPNERRGRRGDNERRGRRDEGERGDRAKATSFFDAAKEGDFKLVKEYLDKGVKVNDTDERGGSAIGLAALAGQSKMVGFLIEEGANVNITSGDGGTPLHGAAFLGQAETVGILIKSGAKVNAQNQRNETPLDSCSGWNDETKGFVELISGFLQIEVDTEKVRAGRLKVAALLKENGGKNGAELASAGPEPLWKAAKTGNLTALEANTNDNSALDAHDEKGITPLSWAANAGQAKAAQWLIDKGANVNGKNRDGNTALHGAAFFGNLEVVELLLKHKAKVNARSIKGETPLDTVSAEWGEETKGILQFIAGILELKIDIQKVEANRPKIVALLRKQGGLTSQQLD